MSRSKAIALNQLRAKESWEQAFSLIVYFSPRVEPPLKSPKTVWIESEDFPPIKRLVEEAAQAGEWACLVNSDIVIDKRLLIVEQELIARSAHCAMSRRWQMPGNKIVDLGLDWFAAQPWIWRQMAKVTPPNFRIGHILWDTWVLAALMHFAPKHTYDCTGSRFVFHPQHEDRSRPHAASISAPRDGIMEKLTWPTKRIDLLHLARTQP